jgi:hypothetical protein
VQNTWIDKALMRDFEAEGTDAYRLGTIATGWAERFGRIFWFPSRIRRDANN